MKNNLTKLFIAIFMSSGFFVFGINQSNHLVNRKAAIIPFFNQSNLQEYEYLSQSVSDILKSFIEQTGKFEIINNDEVVRKLNGAGFNYNRLLWEEQANGISTILNADVIVFGFYSVSGRNVTLYLNALDAETRRSAITLELTSDKGVSLIDNIKRISTTMAEEMSQKLPPLSRRANSFNKISAGSALLGAGIGLTAAMCASSTFMYIGTYAFTSLNYNYSYEEIDLETAGLVLSFFPIIGNIYTIAKSVYYYNNGYFYWGFYGIFQELAYQAITIGIFGVMLLSNILSVAMIFAGAFMRNYEGKGLTAIEFGVTGEKLNIINFGLRFGL